MGGKSPKDYTTQQNYSQIHHTNRSVNVVYPTGYEMVYSVIVEQQKYINKECDLGV